MSDVSMNDHSELASESAPDTSLMPRWLRMAASYALGLLIGLVFHYTLYRMSLPQTPFIYQSF